MPDSSSKSGSPRQPSSRPPFRRDWLGPARKADPQDNLHRGPLSGGIGRGSAFRAGMPDSSSKSGSPRQPSSRPPFRRDWLGIRLSSWNAGFQLEKRIPKTTFITAPFSGQIGCELECRIPARKADPQDNLHHGPLFRTDWLGIFASWNAGFQLEKRIPKTTFITAPFSGQIGWGFFRAGMPDSSLKSGSPRQPSSRPAFRRDWLGRAVMNFAGFHLEKRIPKTTFITAPFQEGLAGDPLFELECRIPARTKTTFITAPFQEGLAGDPLFELECRIPA